METTIVISNIILALLTGVYVLLTYRIVKETKRSNDQNRKFFEKQFLLTTLPHLYITISKSPALAITIYNYGNIPAYDVSLWIYGLYSEDEIDIPSFIVNNVKSEFRKTPLTVNDEGFYSVYDVIRYAIFPHKRKITASLNFLLEPFLIMILLQFREVSGINYSQVHLFVNSTKEQTDFYNLSTIKPAIITPSPRIKIDFQTHQLKTENNEPVPKHISDEFEDLINHSIPSTYTETEWLDNEDRGKWEDI